MPGADNQVKMDLYGEDDLKVYATEFVYARQTGSNICLRSYAKGNSPICNCGGSMVAISLTSGSRGGRLAPAIYYCADLGKGTPDNELVEVQQETAKIRFLHATNISQGADKTWWHYKQTTLEADELKMKEKDARNLYATVQVMMRKNREEKVASGGENKADGE